MLPSHDRPADGRTVTSPSVAVPTRERILDAALAAFAGRGVEGTPITDLEHAAGLAAGSGGFYRYFKTKDEVLAAVVRREIDRVETAAAARPEPAPERDARAEVAATLGSMLDTLGTLGPLMAVLAREQGRIPDLAAEVADRLIDGGLRADSVRLAAALGGDAAADPRAVGGVVMSALVGYTLARGYFGTPLGGIGRDRFIESLAALLAPGQGGGG